MSTYFSKTSGEFGSASGNAYFSSTGYTYDATVLAAYYGENTINDSNAEYGSDGADYSECADGDATCVYTVNFYMPEAAEDDSEEADNDLGDRINSGELLQLWCAAVNDSSVQVDEECGEDVKVVLGAAALSSVVMASVATALAF